MSAYPDALPIGARIGRVQVVDVIGQGGFGIVYAARDPELGEVAVKEFFPKVVASRATSGRLQPSAPDRAAAFERGVARLVEEGRKLQDLDHPGIVKVYDIVEDNGTAYIVMERVRGSNLRQLVEAGRVTPDAGFVEDLARQLADALAYVHGRELVHRDVAPDNILCEERKDGGRRFVLADFGGAKRLVVDMSHSSTTSLVKSGFSPIEQYSREDGGGLRTGPWSDIYGAAAVLYWLVSGAVPLDSVARGAKDTLTPARKAGAGRFRARFLEAVDWGLEVRPDKRPADVATWERTLLGSRGRPRPGRGLALAAAALVLAVAGGGTVGWQHRSDPAVLAALDRLGFDQRERRAYEAARGNLELLRAIAADPQGRFAAAAAGDVGSLDDEAWRAADAEGTIASLLRYVTTFVSADGPPARHADAARDLLESRVTTLQEALDAADCFAGAHAEGVYDAATRIAVEQCQKEVGVDVDGSNPSNDLAATIMAKVGDRKILVRNVKLQLQALDGRSGEVDGELDDATRARIEAFQRDKNLYVDGEPSMELLAALKPAVEDAARRRAAEAERQRAESERQRNISIQTLLAQLQFKPGASDGQWGASSATAARAFQRVRNLSPADGQPSARLLQDLQAARSAGFSNVVCRTETSSEQVPYDDCRDVPVEDTEQRSAPVSLNQGCNVMIQSLCNAYGQCFPNFQGAAQACQADFAGTFRQGLEFQCQALYEGELETFSNRCSCGPGGCACNTSGRCAYEKTIRSTEEQCRTRYRTEQRSERVCECQATESCAK